MQEMVGEAMEDVADYILFAEKPLFHLCVQFHLYIYIHVYTCTCPQAYKHILTF